MNDLTLTVAYDCSIGQEHLCQVQEEVEVEVEEKVTNDAQVVFDALSIQGHRHNCQSLAMTQVNDCWEDRLETLGNLMKDKVKGHW